MRKESETVSFQTLGERLRQWAQILVWESQGIRYRPSSPKGKSPNIVPYSSGRYSRISPGWESSSLQMASSVVKRMALAYRFESGEVSCRDADFVSWLMDFHFPLGQHDI